MLTTSVARAYRAFGGRLVGASSKTWTSGARRPLAACIALAGGPGARLVVPRRAVVGDAGPVLAEAGLGDTSQSKLCSVVTVEGEALPLVIPAFTESTVAAVAMKICSTVSIRQ